MEREKTYCQSEYVPGFYHPDEKLCHACRLNQCALEECPEYEEKELSE